jgi:hypothetical protein
MLIHWTLATDTAGFELHTAWAGDFHLSVVGYTDFWPWLIYRNGRYTDEGQGTSLHAAKAAAEAAIA